MDKQTKTYFIVEIAGADLYFENLQDASDFFAKIVGSKAEKIGRLGYGKDSYFYKDGRHNPSMKQEIIDVYPTQKAAKFAQSETPEQE